MTVANDTFLKVSRLAPLAVASALFMDFIDSTALSTALPTLSRAFHSDPIHLKLCLTSYILTLAVMTPASGWVADRFGAKRVFLSAMAVFLAGSLACALSRSLSELVAARILQGMGGAMMTPVGRLIVVGSAPRERLVSAMASFTMPALLGPMIGPPLAGLVLSVADWPWIFLINLPVGLAGMVAVFFLAPELPKAEVAKFDLRGFGLVAAAIIALEVVAETLGVGLAPPWVMLGLFILGILGFILFVRHVLARDTPILNLRLLALRTYRASLLGGGLMRLSLGAWPFLMPLLLQIGMGWSPAKAGLVSMAQAAGAFAAKYVSTQMVRALGFKRLLVSCGALTAIGTTAPAFFHRDTPALAIAVLLAAIGFMRSNFFTGVNTVAFAELQGRDVNPGATLSSVVQQLTIGLGVSFGALMLHVGRGNHPNLAPGQFLIPFLAIGVAALLAIPIFLRLPADAGDDISREAV